MKKILSLILILTLVFNYSIPILSEVEAKNDNNINKWEKSYQDENYDKKKNKQDLQKQFSVSEEFIQNELNKGYSIEEIEKALWIQTFDKNKYEDSIKKVKPKFINKSKEAKTSVESEYDFEIINRFQLIEQDSDLTSSKKNKVKIAEIEPELEIDDITAKTSEAPYTVSLINENVSTLSGNLSLQSTDLSLPGRNGLGYSLTRTYNSDEAQYYGMDVSLFMK